MAAQLRNAIVMLGIPVGAIVAWWFLSLNSSSPFFPPLQEIVATFRETWLFAHFGSDIVPSLQRLLAGYGLAIGVGVSVGVLLGRIRVFQDALNPLVQFGRSIPATAMVPVGIALLGIGDLPKILLIAFVAQFPILLNTIDGVRGVEPGLEDVARSFGLTRLQRVTAVQLPSAAPQIFSGMRIALGIAFILMIVTEMVGATNGIGFVTLQAQMSLQVAQMWSGMILLGVMGASFNLVFVLLEQRVLRWHYRTMGES